MDRRHFLKTAAGAGLVAASPAADGAAAPATPLADPAIRTGPYLQNPAVDGMTVMWMTTVPAYGYVEYGPTPELGLRADAEIDGLKQSNAVLHRVRLSGLKPGAKYYYRVCAKPLTSCKPYSIAYGEEIRSKVYDFNTIDPSAERVRFLVFNDLHDNVALWECLHAFVANEPVDFVFLNGDITDYLQDEQQMVGHFLDVCTKLFATRVPFLYARGNHEVRGAWSRRLKDYLDLPGDRYYYGFGWGPARFVVLDSGEDKPDAAPVYAGLNAFDAYRSRQQQWLEREVGGDAFAAAKYRIAIHHIPAHYNVGPSDDADPDNHGAVDLRAKWWPAFNQARVDLFIGAHTHRPTIKLAAAAAGHRFPVVIGGGPKKGIGTVMVVEADRTNLRVRLLGDDGNLIGRVNG